MRHFVEELEQLKTKLLEMGSLVEASIQRSISAVTQKDRDAAEEVFRNEERVNAIELEIDDFAIKLLALHQPMAADLRLIVAALKIGAMTRQRDIEYSKDIATHCPVLLEALSHVGHRQTRNRGTIGGSLCHLDPSAELANIAALLDASLHIVSSRGERVLPFAGFATGLGETWTGAVFGPVSVGCSTPTC